jgi:hypothetical protein
MPSQSPREDRPENENTVMWTETPKESTVESATQPSPSAADIKQESRSPSLISSVGSSTANFSDIVNDNLIAARYGAFATIGLLTVYGLSHTPLFFRYRTVAELPSSYFSARKCIKGRLIRAVPATESDQAITCYIRHLSPAERFLSKSWFDWLMKIHPSSAILGKRPDQSERELLRVEIAGIRSPPWYQSSSERPGEWLARLADEHTTVTCQLLARRVFDEETDSSILVGSSSQSQKRSMDTVLPELNKRSDQQSLVNDQVAVCKVYYRHQKFQLVATDMADSMVRFGRSSAATDGLSYAESGGRMIDTTTNVKMLRKDANYLEQLGNAEFEAAKGSYGMWADPEVRKSQGRADVIEEVLFQTEASVWKKMWRWFRGG